MTRPWKIVLAVLLALVVAVGAYAAYVFAAYYRLEDWLPLSVAGPDAAGSPITVAERHRIISYNVGFGAYSDDYSFFMDGGKESRARSPEAVKENIGGAVKTVQAAEPDLVLFQEVDADGDRSHHIDERLLTAEALPESWQVFAQNYDSPYLFWPITEPHGANVAGQMTLSRYPITDALRRSLPIDNGPMKLVDLDRCYSVSRIPASDGRELVLYNFHLSAYTADGAIADNQLKMLFADMLEEVENGNYAIAGGDFNKDVLGSSPEIFGMEAVESNWALPIPEELVPEELRIVAPLDEEDPVPSCRNADRPYGPDDLVLTVDGFVISPNVELVESRVIDAGFCWSDHNPVYLDFILH